MCYSVSLTNIQYAAPLLLFAAALSNTMISSTAVCVVDSRPPSASLFVSREDLLQTQPYWEQALSQAFEQADIPDDIGHLQKHGLAIHYYATQFNALRAQRRLEIVSYDVDIINRTAVDPANVIGRVSYSVKSSVFIPFYLKIEYCLFGWHNFCDGSFDIRVMMTITGNVSLQCNEGQMLVKTSPQVTFDSVQTNGCDHGGLALTIYNKWVQPPIVGAVKTAINQFFPQVKMSSVPYSEQLTKSVSANITLNYTVYDISIPSSAPVGLLLHVRTVVDAFWRPRQSTSKPQSAQFSTAPAYPLPTNWTRRVTTGSTVKDSVGVLLVQPEVIADIINAYSVSGLINAYDTSEEEGSILTFQAEINDPRLELKFDSSGLQFFQNYMSASLSCHPQHSASERDLVLLKANISGVREEVSVRYDLSERLFFFDLHDIHVTKINVSGVFGEFFALDSGAANMVLKNNLEMVLRFINSELPGVPLGGMLLPTMKDIVVSTFISKSYKYVQMEWFCSCSGPTNTCKDAETCHSYDEETDISSDIHMDMVRRTSEVAVITYPMKLNQYSDFTGKHHVAHFTNYLAGSTTISHNPRNLESLLVDTYVYIHRFNDPSGRCIVDIGGMDEIFYVPVGDDCRSFQSVSNVDFSNTSYRVSMLNSSHVALWAGCGYGCQNCDISGVPVAIGRCTAPQNGSGAAESYMVTNSTMCSYDVNYPEVGTRKLSVGVNLGSSCGASSGANAVVIFDFDPSENVSETLERLPTTPLAAEMGHGMYMFVLRVTTEYGYGANISMGLCSEPNQCPSYVIVNDTACAALQYEGTTAWVSFMTYGQSLLPHGCPSAPHDVLITRQEWWAFEMAAGCFVALLIVLAVVNGKRLYKGAWSYAVCNIIDVRSPVSRFAWFGFACFVASSFFYDHMHPFSAFYMQWSQRRLNGGGIDDTEAHHLVNVADSITTLMLRYGGAVSIPLGLLFAALASTDATGKSAAAGISISFQGALYFNFVALLVPCFSILAVFQPNMVSAFTLAESSSSWLQWSPDLLNVEFPIDLMIFASTLLVSVTGCYSSISLFSMAWKEEAAWHFISVPVTMWLMLSPISILLSAAIYQHTGSVIFLIYSGVCCALTGYLIWSICRVHHRCHFSNGVDNGWSNRALCNAILQSLGGVATLTFGNLHFSAQVSNLDIALTPAHVWELSIGPSLALLGSCCLGVVASLYSFADIAKSTDGSSTVGSLNADIDDSGEKQNVGVIGKLLCWSHRDERRLLIRVIAGIPLGGLLVLSTYLVGRSHGAQSFVDALDRGSSTVGPLWLGVVLLVAVTCLPASAECLFELNSPHNTENVVGSYCYSRKFVARRVAGRRLCLVLVSVLTTYLAVTTWVEILQTVSVEQAIRNELGNMFQTNGTYFNLDNSITSSAVKQYGAARVVTNILFSLATLSFLLALVADSCISIRTSRSFVFAGAFLTGTCLVTRFSTNYVALLNLSPLQHCGQSFCAAATKLLASSFGEVLAVYIGKIVLPLFIDLPWTLGRMVFFVDDANLTKCLAMVTSILMVPYTVIFVGLCFMYQGNVEVLAMWITFLTISSLVLWVLGTWSKLPHSLHPLLYLIWGYGAYAMPFVGVVSVATGSKVSHIIKVGLQTAFSKENWITVVAEFAGADIFVTDLLYWAVYDDEDHMTEPALRNRS